MTKRTASASRLLRSRRAASFRLGLRKSRKVRLLVVIVSVQLDRGLSLQPRRIRNVRLCTREARRFLFSVLRCPDEAHSSLSWRRVTSYRRTMVTRIAVIVSRLSLSLFLSNHDHPTRCGYPQPIYAPNSPTHPRRRGNGFVQRTCKELDKQSCLFSQYSSSRYHIQETGDGRG